MLQQPARDYHTQKLKQTLNFSFKKSEMFVF